MHRQKSVFLLCIGSLVFTLNLTASAKIQSAESDDDVSGSKKGLFLMSNEIKETPTTLNAEEEKFKQIFTLLNEKSKMFYGSTSSLYDDGTEATRQSFFQRDSRNDQEKRNAVNYGGSEMRMSASKGKKKKAKALGHLLMNSVANQNYNEIQDDYVDDEDDDYSKGLNGEKMNWGEYQNEDGASVMELIALSRRHKSRSMSRSNWNEYRY